MPSGPTRKPEQARRTRTSAYACNSMQYARAMTGQVITVPEGVEPDTWVASAASPEDKLLVATDLMVLMVPHPFLAASETGES